MAKAKTPAEAPQAGENIEMAPPVQTPLVPSAVTPLEDPAGSATDNIKLNFGEVLMVSLTDGQETGIPFKVSASTYEKYYSDEAKFRLKKTFQP